MADPTINVAGAVNGANVDWTVSFTPDPTLLAGGEGALAVELALEFSEMLVADSIEIDADWMETINGVLIENPGDNPYAGAVTDGVLDYTNVASQLGGAGNINAIFAALGSTKFMSAGEQLALSFSTVGTTGTVTYGGFIAQDENGDFFNVSGSETVVDGPLGDTDGNGTIDLSDLFNVQNNFGLASPPAVGDTDGNGTIDLQDLFNVQNNFGLGPNDGAGALSVSASAVPEPATLALLSLCGIGGLAVARIRRK
jgi:hypothetical protein